MAAMRAPSVTTRPTTTTPQVSTPAQPTSTRATTPDIGAGGPPDGVEYMKTKQGTKVLSQREAGDYYCEHTSWVLNKEALKLKSSVAKDGRRRPLAGFLHIPGGAKDVKGKSRHVETTQVMGAAFRGYVDVVRKRTAKASPVKVMITGFGAFEGVEDNPTGDFVSHRENIDNTMKAAFGTAFVGRAREINAPVGKVLAYPVKDTRNGKPFAVQVLAKKLDVDDTAIDGGPKSVQTLLAKFKPQAAISLGVDPEPKVPSFKAVTRSDFGGLKCVDGKLQHDDSQMQPGESKKRMIVNAALGRAIGPGRSRCG